MSGYPRILLSAGFAILIGGALIGAGCQRELTRLHPAKPPSHRTVFTILRDDRTTWNALKRTIAEFPENRIASSNPATGIIVLEPTTVEIGDYCDCGQMGKTPLYGQAKRQTTIQVKKQDPQKTVVEIQCRYTTTYTWKNVYGQDVRTATVACKSNGRFEQELYRSVIAYVFP